MNSIQRSLTVGISILGVLVLSTTHSSAQESKTTEKVEQFSPVGVWTWERKSGSKTVECKITVVENDGQLSGKYKDEEHDLNLRDAKSENGKFFFAVSPHDEKPNLQIKFEGRLTADSIKGEMTYPSGEATKSIDWLATRQQASDAIVGKWLLGFETPDEVEIEFKIVVKKKNRGITIKFTEDASIEINNVNFENNNLTFQSNLTYNEQPVSVEWDLNLEGNQLDGVLNYQFDDVDTGNGELEVFGERIK